MNMHTKLTLPFSIALIVEKRRK
eukprot:SAG11_NODE_294_length_11142_cov_7.050439_15_plen_22_part_01